MKCPYCGGEISSQSVKCTFCGRENPEGVKFQQEVREKIERNKLLKPLLLKQKTPELVQKMLTRIIVVMTVANVLLLVISFCIFLVTERKEVRTPQPGSQAELFYEEFAGSSDFFHMQYFECKNEYIDMIEAGETPDEWEVEVVVDYAYKTISNLDEYDSATKEMLKKDINAFFMGYIGLSEEEMDFLEPDENGEFPYFMDYELEEKTVALILEKQKEVQK